MTDIEGKIVFHSKYGNGIVESIEEVDHIKRRLVVLFDDKICKFDFPSCFVNGFLKTDDEELKGYVDNYEIEAIYSNLASRKIKSFIHFTVLDNLPGILKEGIIPRSDLGDNGFTLDKKRLDGETNGSCFTLAFPNYKMFYKYRNRNANRVFVILGVSISFALNLKKEQIAFYPANAALKDLRGTYDEHQGVASLEYMFSENPYGSPDGYRRSMDRLPDKYTTNPQAEVIIKAVVPPKYIWRIYVESEKDKHITIKRIGRRYSDIIQVYPELFDKRFDYERWQ